MSRNTAHQETLGNEAPAASAGARAHPESSVSTPKGGSREVTGPRAEGVTAAAASETTLQSRKASSAIDDDGDSSTAFDTRRGRSERASATTPKNRQTVNLRPRDQRRLGRLMAHTGGTANEAIRIALAVAEIVIDAVEKGGTVRVTVDDVTTEVTPLY